MYTCTGKYIHFTFFIDYTDSRIMNMTLDSIVVDIITFFSSSSLRRVVFIHFFFSYSFRKYGVQNYARWYVPVDLIHVMQFTQFAIPMYLKWYKKKYVCVWECFYWPHHWIDELLVLSFKLKLNSDRILFRNYSHCSASILFCRNNPQELLL